MSDAGPAHVLLTAAPALCMTYCVACVWWQLLREHAGPDLIIMLVGNKTDLNHLRVISIEAGRVRKLAAPIANNCTESSSLILDGCRHVCGCAFRKDHG